MLPWGTKLEVDGDLGPETTLWGSHGGYEQVRVKISWPTEGRMKALQRGAGKSPKQDARWRAKPPVTV